LAQWETVSKTNHTADRLRANATNGYRRVIRAGELILQWKGSKL